MRTKTAGERETRQKDKSLLRYFSYINTLTPGNEISRFCLTTFASEDEEDISPGKLRQHISDVLSSCESENNDLVSTIEENSDSDLFPIRKRYARIPSYVESHSDINQNIDNVSDNESNCVSNEIDALS